MSISIIIMLAILIGTLFVGISVPMAFFAATFYMITVGGYDTTFLFPYAYSKSSSIVLLAIPLYIIAGGIIERGDIGAKLVGFVESLIGNRKGSLGVVAVVSCAIFGSITGSASATQSVIGSIMWPRMDAAGYEKGKTAALIASSCLIGGLIPPSSLMILYAWSTQQNVLACFMACFVPGILMTILLSVAYVRMVKNENINWEACVPEYESKKEKIAYRRKTMIEAIPALMFPVIVVGGIYAGLMTPTEAAAVSSVYALVVGFFVYRKLSVRNLYEVVVESAKTIGAIMFMLFMVMMISRIFIMEDVPQQFLKIILSVTDNKYLILLFVNLFLIIIGMLMDDVSATLLCGPLLLPTMVAIGVSPVQFAAILCCNISLGCVTPPCAPNLYLSARLSKTPINIMLQPTMQYILRAWLPLLLIVTYIPAVSLGLPKLMGLV